MRTQFRLSKLIPAELAVGTVTESTDTIIVNTRAVLPHRSCPRCGTRTARIHSHYVRTVSDLPCCGRRVELRVVARRFICPASYCDQKIFAERFGGDTLAPRARRTARLECLLHHLGLALGG